MSHKNQRQTARNKTPTVTGNAPVTYFSLSMDEQAGRADIYIFGNIRQAKGGLSGVFQADSDQSSYDLANQISRIPEDWDIVVHINSYGGEIKEGLGIYNVLKARNVTTICEGFAASAASVIFCAGRTRIMQPASLIFIHQAFTEVEGNADDFAKAAEDLRIVTGSAIAAYKECGVNVSDEELTAMLKAETWITPEDALRMGFATQIADEEDDGIIANDAMRSIMAAVTGDREGCNALDEYADVFAFARKAMAYAEAHDAAIRGLVDGFVDGLEASAPLPVQDEQKKETVDEHFTKKGFFNF